MSLNSEGRTILQDTPRGAPGRASGRETKFCLKIDPEGRAFIV